MKIALIFTGGTIGSSLGQGVVNLDGGSARLLLDLYRKKYGNGVEFVTYFPVQLLSEDVQPEDLAAIKRCVQEAATKGVDGMIVTHGSDTLYFTANLFSQLFCDLPIPLVFVCSLFPLRDERSNGLDNFAGAIDFIREGLPGAYVSFRNPGDEGCKIHLASRITYANQINGSFYSVLGVPFGKIENERFVHLPNPHNPTISQIRLARKPCPYARVGTDIVVIRARSFLDFRFYRFTDPKPKAVVIELYHSGTVCTKGTDLNVLEFLKYCKQAGVPAVLAPVDSQASVYASAADIRSGCLFAYDMSFEMTVVKVMLAVGSDADLSEALSSDLFFEKIR